MRLLLTVLAAVALLAPPAAQATAPARKLAQTEAALDIVGKAHALLEMLSESADSDDKHKK